ncbi:MAG: RNA 2',3'-cyclic phosphodiesterase [Brevinematales bacterium]|nr:RNA 2',3'-cyclic phosphodiesterase [Brevinematales bacterium]
MDRLFIAIDIPDNIKKLFSEITQNLNTLKAKTVPIENIHLTIKFIGETNKTNEIIECLKLVKQPNFIIFISSVGIFGNLYNPRVFWVGVERSDELKSLHQNIENKLLGLGISRDDREFSPHITLARFKIQPEIKKLEKLIEKYKNTTFGSFTVENFILYKSDLSNINPIYTKLGVFKIG